MTKISIEVRRDENALPKVVTIKKGRRKKLEAKFDYSPSFDVFAFTLDAKKEALPSYAEILQMIYPQSSIVKVRGLEWFDRNPESKADHYSGILAFHGAAQKCIYTCPEGKKAMVELLTAVVVRTAVAAAAGDAGAWWSFRPKGAAGEEELVYAYVPDTNVKGDRAEEFLGTTLTMSAGDKIRGLTANMSDGACFFFLAYKLTEFDV